MMISEFLAFTGKIEHAHTVCTRPGPFLTEEGPRDKATTPYKPELSSIVIGNIGTV